MSKEFTGKPLAFDALHVLRSKNTGIEIDEILIDERILQAKKCVKDLAIDLTKLILLGIYNEGNFNFNPQEDYVLMQGDILIVIGRDIVIEEYSLNLHKAIT